MVQGSKSLRKAKIQERVTALLNELLRDDVVDSQLARVVMQDYKLDAKVAAIKEYNRVRNRVDDAPKILMIGKILQNVESQNELRTKTTRQRLPTPDLLLDKGQERIPSFIPKKQSSKRL